MAIFDSNRPAGQSDPAQQPNSLSEALTDMTSTTQDLGDGIDSLLESLTDFSGSIQASSTSSSMDPLTPLAPSASTHQPNGSSEIQSVSIPLGFVPDPMPLVGQFQTPVGSSSPSSIPPAGSGLPAILQGLTEGMDYSNQVIVKFKSGIQMAAMQSIQAQMDMTMVASAQTLGMGLWDVGEMSMAEAMHTLGQYDWIEYIEPNYTLSVATTIPNDPSFNQLWGLNNTGQTGGTFDADIDAPEAWTQSTGQGIVVGVIDSGVDYTHPDLIDNMWVNAGEIAGDGIDNDNNGYIDDYYGYDFANNDGDPFDDNNHGTHVAGTIAAQDNNGIGVTGVAPDAQIMALKFIGADGSGSTFDAIRAIDYAVMMGADITNNSWGGGGYSQALYDAIARAEQAGQLFIASAGNGGFDGIGDNNDLFPSYPASYDLDNIISVAATDHNDQLASFSNYGANSVDLAAPGVSVLSTLSGGGYGSLNGTSMAAPHVAGVAALLMAQDPTLTADQVKAQILAGVDPVAGLNGLTVTGGRLNANQALSGTPPIPTPSSPLFVETFESGSLSSAWTSYTTETGRVQVSDTYAASGNYALLLDDAVNGGAFSTAGAMVRLDASNVLNAQLDFKWLDLSDESHVGSDAVLISQDDGETWTEVYALTEGSSPTWTEVSVDLGAYLQPTTDDFLIAFQQYDNYSAPLDGIAIDDIVVTETITAAQPDLSESFESGRFSTAWSKFVTNDGRVQVTSDYAYDGAYGILLDDDLNGGNSSTAAATLHLDGSGLNSTDMMLSFRWLDLNDEYDAGLDGVFVSDDAGNTWHEVYAFEQGSASTWSLGVVDLGTVAATHGINLAGDFQIKFQQHDNFSAPTDGIAIDYVKVFEV